MKADDLLRVWLVFGGLFVGLACVAELIKALL